RIAPAVIRTHELDRVAFVVPADLHPAMPARVEEHVDLAATVARQDDRLLAHRRDEEIAGLRDLAFMADEEPRAGEHAVELLAIDLFADKNLAADDAFLDVDQAVDAVGLFVTVCLCATVR